MPNIDLSSLDAIEGIFDKLIEAMPEQKRAFHERAGAAIKAELDVQVDQHIDDSAGKIKGWQAAVVGSKGGYTKIRPVGSNEGAETGPNGPGAKTDYIVSGHAIRGPSGRDKNYRPRIRVARVQGRNFYEATIPRVDTIATREAEAVMENLSAIIDGEG